MTRDRPRRSLGRRRLAASAAAVTAGLLLAACADDPGPATRPTTTATSPAPTTEPMDHHPDAGATMRPTDRARAHVATAAFQDVAVAESAGYASTLDALGCFEDPELGGMGVHYLDQALMDDTVDVAHPEALVYELRADGTIDGLVAHEYIVPVEAWTEADPPTLFGVDFHRHPTLPLWVLHTWIWKDNVAGVFADWNPAVRMCPADVPIFGRDLP